MFDGQPITGLPTPQIIRRGIGSVPEARRLFGTMTVRENVLMGAYHAQRQGRPSPQDYERMLDAVPASGRTQRPAGRHAVGRRAADGRDGARADGPARACICMDEPTMGLSPLFVDQVLELIQTVNRQGVTVFMVEQNASLALQIAHHGYVLRTGRIVLSGNAGDLLNDPQIRDAYLGGAEAA